jgi:hypothetical protein
VHTCGSSRCTQSWQQHQQWLHKKHDVRPLH